MRGVDPDLFLAMETNAWWDGRLAGLRDRLPHGVRHVPHTHGFYGMHLFSRHELVEPRVEFPFDASTPMVSTGVRLPGGGTVFFQGLHPRPPLWSQPATLRDAQLLSAALDARASALPAVLAGDFNAVPWARVVRRAARIGGLLDPRVGRGLHPTFDATRGPLVSWPIDQVLHQGGFALLAFRVLPAFGSDHYPVLADLCLGQGAAAKQAAPALAAGDIEEARAAIAAARAVAGAR